MCLSEVVVAVMTVVAAEASPHDCVLCSPVRFRLPHLVGVEAATGLAMAEGGRR